MESHKSGDLSRYTSAVGLPPTTTSAMSGFYIGMLIQRHGPLCAQEIPAELASSEELVALVLKTRAKRGMLTGAVEKTWQTCLNGKGDKDPITRLISSTGFDEFLTPRRRAGAPALLPPLCKGCGR